MVRKKKEGQEEDIKYGKILSGIVAIEGHFQFERAVFVLNISFRFRMLQLN